MLTVSETSCSKCWQGQDIFSDIETKTCIKILKLHFLLLLSCCILIQFVVVVLNSYVPHIFQQLGTELIFYTGFVIFSFLFFLSMILVLSISYISAVCFLIVLLKWKRFVRKNGFEKEILYNLFLFKFLCSKGVEDANNIIVFHAKEPLLLYYDTDVK